MDNIGLVTNPLFQISLLQCLWMHSPTCCRPAAAFPRGNGSSGHRYPQVLIPAAEQGFQHIFSHFFQVQVSSFLSKTVTFLTKCNQSEFFFYMWLLAYLKIIHLKSRGKRWNSKHFLNVEFIIDRTVFGLIMHFINTASLINFRFSCNPLSPLQVYVFTSHY